MKLELVVSVKHDISGPDVGPLRALVQELASVQLGIVAERRDKLDTVAARSRAVEDALDALQEQVRVGREQGPKLIEERDAAFEARDKALISLEDVTESLLDAQKALAKPSRARRPMARGDV